MPVQAQTLPDTPTHPPLEGGRLYLLLFSLGLAAFIDTLDFSIANVSIPSIASGFGVSTSQGTWVITLYAVTSSVSLALAGRLSMRLGSARLVILSTFLFSISSLLCGLAWSFPALLFFRMLQGATGGALSAIPPGLMFSCCSPRQKDLIGAIFFVCIVVPAFLGPLVGGWITEYYGWRWIFFINLPLGICSAVITWLVLRNRLDPPTLSTPLDLVGFFFLASGLMLFQVFLDQGNEHDWFESTYILILACGFFSLFCSFLIWNWYASNPLIDFSFLRNRNFFMALIATCGMFFVASMVTILLPLWLQTQMGYTPLQAGMASMPIGILPLFLTPLIGAYLLPYRCLRWLTTFGVIAFSLACFLYSGMTTQATMTHIMSLRFFQGLGIACTFLPLFTLALQQIDKSGNTRATALYHFVRLTFAGAGVATAFVVTAWKNWASFYHVELGTVMQGLRPATVEVYEILKKIGIENKTIAMILENQVSKQAYLLSYNDIHWIAGWLLLLTLPFIWLCKEAKEVQPSSYTVH